MSSPGAGSWIRCAVKVLVFAGAVLLHGLAWVVPARAETGLGTTPTNGLLWEYWTNLPGISVRMLTDLPDYPLKPNVVAACTNFEIAGLGYDYGERLRGLLQAPVTGDYTFWIASDDASALWLSTDENPAHKHRLARVTLFTGAHDFGRYWEQRSDPVHLEEGKRYYIEALHKQGPSVDHLSVAWTLPGGGRELIPTRWLQPWNDGNPGEGITREVWTNNEGATAVSQTQMASAAAPKLDGGNVAGLHQRLRGYIHPPLSGDYAFFADNSRLILGADDTPAGAAETGSQPVRLEGGRSYYFEAEPNNPAEAFSIGWQMPDGLKQFPVSARFLTPYDSDYDGMPDWYEKRHGLDLHNPDDALADGDGDGLSNIEEFQRGSDPQFFETFTDLPPLLSVQQIREPAPAKPVRVGERLQLRGVVTYSFQNHDFYLQDGTGGIYVEARGHLAQGVSAGEMVRVAGVIASEGIPPTVVLTTLTVLGNDILPASRSVALDPLYEGLAGIVDFAGAADAERVEIEGIVRSASLQDDWINGRNLVLRAITTSGQFEIRCPDPGSRSLDKWIDTSIRVRGVASIKPQPRSIGLVIHAPRLPDIFIESEPSRDVFAAPMRSIRSLVKFYWHDVGHHVGVEGTVLYAEPGKMLFIRDDTGAMQVLTSQHDSVHPGDKVRIVGFPAPGDYSAVLTDAVFQKEGEGASIAGVDTTPADIMSGKFNCDLVSLQGTVVDHLFSADRQGFWLKADNTLYDAYWSATNGVPAAAGFEKDSVVKLTGIALLQDASLVTGPQTFHLLLPSVDAVSVIRQPPWLTSRRLFWISMTLAGSILLGTAWVMFLAQKQKALEAEVGRRKRAEQGLQHAHQELEKRMTAELREEVGRRERSEAEFQAVLRERTRIAQELHDTLEQGLVGIALQLDNVADVVDADVPQAREHLELARRLVEHSQAETRRSVWDLRSETLEQGGLLAALNKVAVELRAGANVPIEVASRGAPGPLPVLVENNLFRIGQEALTNALKHARPSRISVGLEFQPAAVTLEIQDDGAGFDTRRPMMDGHHFGLQGIRERVKRLGGAVEIKSEPGRGTQIRVRVPLASDLAGTAGPA